MRMTRLPTLFLIAAMVPVSGVALAQSTVQIQVPPMPRVTVNPTVSAGGYSISTEQVLVLGAGVVGGFVVGQYLFVGHLGPIVTGVAGAYLANMWYNKS
jgi:hypothetical protein